MAPPAINDTNTHDNLLDKARDYVHKKVATEKQLQQEKPIDQKVKEALPNDMQDAVNKTGSVLGNVKNDVVQKFNERVDEGTERAQRHKEDPEGSKGPIGQLKDKIYDNTKSQSLQDREQFQQADLMGKLHMMQNMNTNEKVKDSTPPATQL